MVYEAAGDEWFYAEVPSFPRRTQGRDSRCAGMVRDAIELVPAERRSGGSRPGQNAGQSQVASCGVAHP
jgi:hypothetical protein